MSPIAVIIGVATVSRSHPRRYDVTAITIVTPRINTDASTPPTTEIVTSCQNEIDGNPKAALITRAEAELGPVSLLVANAGIVESGAIEELPLAAGGASWT